MAAVLWCYSVCCPYFPPPLSHGVTPGHSRIPATPCGRVGGAVVRRNSTCGLVNNPPVLPNALTETRAGVRLLGDRFRALRLNVPTGAHITEIGTLDGHLRRWMLATLRPARLTIMDITKSSIAKCNKQHAHLVEKGSVTCVLGPSQQSLLALPDNSQDLIYVDGHHDYKGVCGDLEAAVSECTQQQQAFWRKRGLMPRTYIRYRCPVWS